VREGGVTVSDITCPKYDPLPGERRCLWYLTNGGCARSDEFMCVEWMWRNPPKGPPRLCQPIVVRDGRSA